jgi:hypothetical protein
LVIERIKVADLPEFDATPYLDSEAAIAASCVSWRAMKQAT